MQIRGNAFYDIGKRTRARLRVETPCLVAVIKGTQFNASAQEGGTTIALFEGHLEARATDDSDVVDLNDVARRFKSVARSGFVARLDGMNSRWCWSRLRRATIPSRLRGSCTRACASRSALPA